MSSILQLTACIWFGLTPSPKSPSATSDTRKTLGDISAVRKEGKGMDFTGTWYIYEMEMWAENYFNMEVQAYIKIESNNRGDFQFGLVSGAIDGKVVDYADGKRFEFTWEGNDECDLAHGSGWIRIKKEDLIGLDCSHSARFRSNCLSRVVRRSIAIESKGATLCAELKGLTLK